MTNEKKRKILPWEWVESFLNLKGITYSCVAFFCRRFFCWNWRHQCPLLTKKGKYIDLKPFSLSHKSVINGGAIIYRTQYRIPIQTHLWPNIVYHNHQCHCSHRFCLLIHQRTRMRRAHKRVQMEVIRRRSILGRLKVW